MSRTESASTEGAWPRFNSLLAHSVRFASLMVLLFAITSMFVLIMRPPPSAQTITLYEIARMLDRLPIGKTVPLVSIGNATTLPPQRSDPTSRLLAAGIAHYARVPIGAVRLDVQTRPQVPLTTLETEARLFGPDSQFNPPILGPFTAALRSSDGSWTLLMRGGRNEQSILNPRNIYWTGAWLVLGFILAFCFSRRVTRPIKQFSDAAERIGKGDGPVQVPVTGPTEIRKAAITVNEMQARIARYVAERTSVVAAIAHDLRAPLSRLNFHLASAPPKLRKEASIELNEMEALIRVTLEFVEHETRRHDPVPIDISLLVESVVQDFADLGGKVRFTEAAHAILRGDPLLLRRMVANLIDNALKYAGEAEVSVHAEPSQININVLDNGPSMTPESLARAFEPFFRGEPSRNRGTGGVGLGLSIVKSAAEAHGGRVDLSNRPEGGFHARVILPLSREDYSMFRR